MCILEDVYKNVPGSASSNRIKKKKISWKRKKKSKYPSAEELINNWWHIHTTEYYISMRMNELQIHQHEVICQKLIWGGKKTGTKWHTLYYIKFRNRQIETDRQSVIFEFRIVVILSEALMAEKCTRVTFRLLVILLLDVGSEYRDVLTLSKLI